MSNVRDHRYVHRYSPFKCLQCQRTFPFKSGVNNHRRAHLSQKLFKCFAGRCQKAYKHPQDLHRHVKSHLRAAFWCSKCGHLTYQKRLLKWHEVTHKDEYKYKACTVCLEPSMPGQWCPMRKPVTEWTKCRTMHGYNILIMITVWNLCYNMAPHYSISVSYVYVKLSWI